MDVVVLVLGDVGRSPRMQYHCLSLEKLPSVGNVYLVGTMGEACVPEVERSQKIKKKLIEPPITADLPGYLYPITMPIKLLQQMIQLFLTLMFYCGSPEYILVQNPPCIPTFVLVMIIAWFKGSKVIIDWHNLGFSILALRFGERHPLVKLAKLYEKMFCKVGHHHLCVTGALKNWLSDEFKLDPDTITVMYDKAPDFFYPRNTVEQHRLFYKLGDGIFQKDFGKEPCGMYETPFTKAILAEGETGSKNDKESEPDYDPYKDDNPSTKFKVIRKPDRPALVVSSTSWTPDEDFGILFEALEMLDEKVIKEMEDKKSDKFDFPQVICVVTGKGPQKKMYEEKIKNLPLENVYIRTMWLETQDYPALIGTADIGVCLHTSSSGLDLPMKVVDMFGSGTPVCAVEYNCISELVKHDINGKVFKTASDLCDQLFFLLRKDEKGEYKNLIPLEVGVRKTNKERWEEQWTRQVKPIFIPIQHPPPRIFSPYIFFALLLVPGLAFAFNLIEL